MYLIFTSIHILLKSNVEGGKDIFIYMCYCALLCIGRVLYAVYEKHVRVTVMFLRSSVSVCNA